MILFVGCAFAGCAFKFEEWAERMDMGDFKPSWCAGCGWCGMATGVLLSFLVVFVLAHQQTSESKDIVLLTDLIYPVINDGCWDSEVASSMKDLLDLPDHINKLDDNANMIKNVILFSIWSIIFCVICCGVNLSTDGACFDCFLGCEM